MRNLKRALSLALASVMLLGMMVVGTSAKGLDFGDAAEINNADAVAVTSEIGIFKGYDDGEFKPANAVTRAEMAVIIAKMLYGADVKADQFAEIDTFTDVPAWAEGYVNLVASLGIVAGRGNGIFDPNATVTTAEAAMMLTKALGYFQSSKDFGTDWMLAATAKATELGLYGDMKLSAKAPLNRENVAVMVFNALTKAVPVQYNELLGVYYNENQGIIYSLEFNYLQTLGYKNFDLVYKTNTETMYGRPATTWGFGTYNSRVDAGSSAKVDVLTENGGLISSKVRMLSNDEIVTIANVPTVVYTAGKAEKDVYKDLGANVCFQGKDAEYTWFAFVNGEEVDAKVPGKNVKTDYEYTGEGAVTEIYVDDATGFVTVVEYNYYLGQVSKVKADEDGEYITVKALSAEPKLDDKTFYVEGYEKNDYVVFTVDTNDDGEFVIAELVDPAIVTGDVSRVESDKNDDNTYLRVDGTKYPYSGVDHIVYDMDAAKIEKVHPALNTEYDLYMDPNGYVLGFKIVDEEESYSYLYVKDSDEELKDWIAKVILADASTEKVDVKSKLKGAGENDPTSIAWTNVEYTSEKVSNIDYKVWKYTTNDAGAYTLTYVENNTLENAEIKNGKAYISEGVNDFIVDKKTVFVDTVNDVTYTGYKEVPNISNADIIYIMDKNVIEIAFIMDGDFYNTNATYFMLTDLDRETLKADGEYFWAFENAYVNGEKQEIVVSYDALKAFEDDVNLAKGTLYQALKTDDNGYFTKIERPETVVAKAEVYALGDDAFWLTDEQDKKVKFDCDEETIFVLVEKNLEGKLSITEGSLSDLEERDEFETFVTVVTADEEYAQLVYIIAYEQAEEEAK